VLSRQPQDTSAPSNKASDHKNEGFLKSAWHRLTHQHDNLEPDESAKNESKGDGKNDKDEEEPKKASGSG
jgi:molecular chaperone DnaJ